MANRLTVAQIRTLHKRCEKLADHDTVDIAHHFSSGNLRLYYNTKDGEKLLPIKCVIYPNGNWDIRNRHRDAPPIAKGEYGN